MKTIPLNPNFAERTKPHWPPLLAIVTGSRRTGHGIITVTRRGKTHRHRVSLKRFNAVRITVVRFGWFFSGSMMRSAFDINLWGKERRWQNAVRVRTAPDHLA